MAKPSKLRPQDAQIMKTIVDVVCGGRVKLASLLIGTYSSSISFILSGKYAIAPHLGKIRKAFPLIDEKFLETGEGNPGYLTAVQTKEALDAVIREKDEQIARLTLEMETQRKVIEMLLPKSTK
uniref:hypothetical protein n=1 Tax=Candidatus Cryptobacteroides bacterium TaxID=3085639 RepID=UPI00402681B1